MLAVRQLRLCEKVKITFIAFSLAFNSTFQLSSDFRPFDPNQMMDRGGGLGKKLRRDGAEETRIKALFPAYSHPLLISTLPEDC